MTPIWTLAVLASAAPEPTFERVAFDLPDAAMTAAAVDWNRDEKPDIVAVMPTRVVAYIAPDWKPVPLVSFRGGRVIHCVEWDADGDGDLDLAVGRFDSPWSKFRAAKANGKPLPKEPDTEDFAVAWIENTGRMDEKRPVHVVDHEPDGVHGLATGDVDGDGKIDLVAGSIFGPSFADSILGYATSPTGKPHPRKVISQGGAKGRLHYLDVADVTGDGQPDVLAAASAAGWFAYWERPAKPDEPWKRTKLAEMVGATHARAGDLNGDGKVDVIVSCGHGRGVSWLEAPTWTPHVIDDKIQDAHALALGDFDADGDLDIAASSYTEKIVVWYENQGKGRFLRHDIDRDQECYDLKAVDMDGDGHLDLLLGGRQTKNVVWYRNVGSKPAPTNTAQPSLEESFQALKISVKLVDGKVVALSGKEPEAIPDALWSRLKAEGKLQTINVSSVSVRTLRHVSEVPTLQSLTIGGNSTFTDKDFALIAKLADLRELSFHHIQGVSGAGFEQLVGLKHLAKVKVHHCHPFKNEAYPHLAKLVALKELDLTVLDSTPKGLAPLKECKGLEKLDVAHFKGDGLIEAVAEMSQLKHVTFFSGNDYRKVTAGEVDAITRMTHLDQLKLYNTDLTDDQMGKIKTSLPSTDIEIRRKDKLHQPSRRIIQIAPERPRRQARGVSFN